MGLLWLTAFAWTLAIELPIYTYLVGGYFRRWWGVVVVAIGINLVTHPMLWFVFPRLEPRWLYLVAGETTVILIEAVLLAIAIRRPLHALGAAIAANFASIAGGVILWWIVL